MSTYSSYQPTVTMWRAPSCQPFGAALFIDREGIILTLTDSTSRFFEAPEAPILLGQHIEEVCPPLFEVWMERVQGVLDPRDWTRVTWGGNEFDARAVPFEEYWLLDVWPAGHTVDGWNEVQNVATVVREWLQKSTFDLSSALENYRKWLDFDMAVVYHLEDSGEGEIIAESKSAEVPSLLGLHYPVAQLGNFAQALGYQNVARNIVDIQAPSTKWWTIEPSIDPGAAELSVCRELDDHHAYLMNTLGLRSALMLPLVMEGQVKGLLIAYCKEQKLLSGVSLLVARTFAQSLSLKINEHELRTRFTYEHDLRAAWAAVEQNLISRTYHLNDQLHSYGQFLLKLVNAQHVFKYQHNTNTWEHYGEGEVEMSPDAVSSSVAWLSKKIPYTIDAYGAGVYATDFLQGSAKTQFDFAAGVLALRLPNKDLLIFTRPATIRSIDTSRRSQWMYAHIHKLYGHSIPWNQEEISNARAFLKLQCQQFQGTSSSNVVDPLFYYDAVVVYALDGRILYMNAVARAVAHSLYAVDHTQPVKIYDLLGGDTYCDKEAILKGMEKAYHSGAYACEWVMRSHSRNNSVQAVFQGHLQRHELDNGDVYFSYTGKDITDIRQAEYEKQFLEDSIPIAQRVSSENFRTILTDEIEELKRIQSLKPGLVLLIDLDGTKNFIKSIGQAATDEICQWFYRRLTHIMGHHTKISHLGSDEFAVIIPEISNESQAWLLAQTIIHNISKPMVVAGFQDTIRLTGCIGMAFYPNHGSTAADLLLAADNAMYAAKRAGKAQIRMHDPDSSVSVSQKFQRVGELRRAIQNNELRAYFQPQFNAITKEIIGAEALVRWEHPTSGLLLPSMFIHDAEDSGLIDKLGEWVLHDTLRQLGNWPEEYKSKIVVSVNASVRQLRDQEHFLYVVDSALKQFNVKPSSLEIEITETIWMDNNDEAIDTLHALRKRGISVAIDDFGTGYSNIAYLQNFPVDKLKFDRSFVIAGQESEGGREILRAMVGLAKALNMDVLAEGVETSTQEKMLLEVGVEKVQGFAYAKPMPEHDFLLLLKNQKPH